MRVKVVKSLSVDPGLLAEAESYCGEHKIRSFSSWVCSLIRQSLLHPPGKSSIVSDDNSDFERVLDQISALRDGEVPIVVGKRPGTSLIVLNVPHDYCGKPETLRQWFSAKADVLVSRLGRKPT